MFRIDAIEFYMILDIGRQKNTETIGQQNRELNKLDIRILSKYSDLVFRLNSLFSKLSLTRKFLAIIYCSTFFLINR